MIRRLFLSDWPEMDRILLENHRPSKTPHMDEFTELVRIAHHERVAGNNPGRKGADDRLSHYYGNFDESDELICWCHWRIWDVEDEAGSATFGSNYATGMKEMPTNDGSFWRSPVVDMVNLAITKMHDLGIGNIYTLRPGPAGKPIVTGWHRRQGLDWQPWTTVERSLFRKYDWENVDFIRPNEPITNPFWTKYLWGGPAWFPATIVRAIRKAEEVKL